MTTKQKILQSLIPLIEDLQFVIIDDKRVQEVAKELLSADLPPWDNDLQLLGTPEETAQYYFFVDSINFCFWAPKGETRWEYEINGAWVGGYYAYSRAIKDAFLKSRHFFDAKYLQTIPEDVFRAIFESGRNKLLLLEERLQIIRENFSILSDQFDGQAINLIEQTGKDADKIVELLTASFPSFRDSALWEDSTLYFLKRAQIFASDVSYTGLPELAIANLDHLTVFADYKLPQILESFGVLTYAPELDADIRNEVLIPPGSRKEIEIRACAITAVERIRDEMERLGRALSSNELDWILWVKAKQTTFIKPHHKTLTTFY
ncbi:hypothetical protein HY416_03995 [Candidatus Kaiserbacteria bacterium]|nr:hypothetical protein [Candidatus Kaiserbacteria bacterium]